MVALTLNETINKYSELAANYARSAASKKYYNEAASERDLAQSLEYKQIADWLTEFSTMKEAVK